MTKNSIIISCPTNFTTFTASFPFFPCFRCCFTRKIPNSTTMSSSSTPTVILRNLKIGEAKSLPDIVISGKEKRTVGRSVETQITSPTVSREHRKCRLKFMCLFDTKTNLTITPRFSFSPASHTQWWSSQSSTSGCYSFAFWESRQVVSDTLIFFPLFFFNCFSHSAAHPQQSKITIAES